MPKKTQIIISVAIGCIFISVLLVLAMVFPHPTYFQYTVFRIVLALAAAGLAAMLPGFIEVAWSGVVRAGGAFGIFVVVYFFSPAAIVTSSIGEKPLQAQDAQQSSQKDGASSEQATRSGNQITIHQRGGQIVVGNNNQVGDSFAHSQNKPPLQEEVEKKNVGDGKKSGINKPHREYIQQHQEAAPLSKSRAEAKQTRNVGLTWQADIETKPVTWPAAQEYCKNLALNGYTDWRLPTIRELEGFVDKRLNPPVNPSFGALLGSYLPYFWASTTEPDDNNEAQFMNFKFGLPAHINKKQGFAFARCVRDGDGQNN